MNDNFLYGINPVREALRNKRRAFELFVQLSASDHRISKIVALADESGIPVRRREKIDLERIANTQHHQGVVLRIPEFEYMSLDDFISKRDVDSPPMFLLLLDGIQDPQNLGAIIRSAACAGVNAVVIPRDRAAGVTPAVEKAAAGAVELLPVIQVTNMYQTIETLKGHGCWIFGLAPESATTIYQVDYDGHLALVIGAEANGIRPLVQKGCDSILSIPQYAGVASLNASVAAGIVLFEAARRRSLK